MPSSASSFAALVRLIRYARPYRSRLVLASACSVLNKLFDVAPEILIGVAIDVVVRSKASFVAALGVTEALSQVYLLGALTLLIWVCESLFEFAYPCCGVVWRRTCSTPCAPAPMPTCNASTRPTSKTAPAAAWWPSSTTTSTNWSGSSTAGPAT